MTHSNHMRRLALIALATATVALSACGSDAGSGSSAPKGSPSNPLVADTSGGTEGGGATREPGYQALLEGQESDPRSSFTPCDLVTQAQARAILGAAIEQPLEAAQGPTCIYRSRDGKSFVTVAVQDADFGRIKRRIRGREAIEVASETAYCGNYGQPMLYLPLRGGRVLSVAGQCDTAKRFAAKALAELSG
jgi:Protein of unknown function (DUF3558)